MKDLIGRVLNGKRNGTQNKDIKLVFHLQIKSGFYTESEKNNMKLGDIYKNKENNSIIQIDSFAVPMGRFCEEKTIIVFRKIESEIGSCPSFNGYGTQEEIEAEYELLVPQKELNNYCGWEEIFRLIKKSE